MLICRRNALIPLQIAAMALLIVCAAAAQPDDGLLFHASFDAGLDAQSAAGCPVGHGEATRTSGSDGKTGEALVAQGGFPGARPFLAPWYLTAGNINREAGTVELWIKPLPGLLTEPELRRIIFHSWIERTRKANPRVFRIDTNHGLLRIFEQEVGEDYSSHIQIPLDAWQEGQWHHIAYTWGDGERVAYVDGVEKGRASPGRGLPTLGAFFRIGAGNWAMGPAHCLIDEVRIWNRALTPDEMGWPQ